MSTYMVFEKVPDTMANGHAYAAPVPAFTQSITCVDADSPKEAIDLVMGATRRVGQYAVIECDYFSFTTDIEATSGADGLLKRKRTEPERRQLSRADEMARDNDKRLRQIEEDIDRIRELGDR